MSVSVSDRSVVSLAASGAAAVFLFASVLIITDQAGAQVASLPSTMGMITDPAAQDGGGRDLPTIRANVEPGDDAAALEAVEIALTQASDGATYVWRRGGGRLMGAVRPTMTFRDIDKRICRHIEMELRLGTYTRRTEGIACRGTDGVWLLEG